jgi:large subunit ribosomal protein L24
MAKKIKIRKGDTVEVITGSRDDKGKRGEVIRVDSKHSRVVVQSLNVHKKHQRQYQYEGRTLETGIIEFEAPMNISNVMLVCPKCDKAVRVGYSRDEEGVNHRVCKACKEEIN